MKYTKKIKDAIKFATKTHEVYQKQTRKGKDIPYITHPLAVGLILALARANEDVVVAGILHDTIEDSPYAKKVTPEMLVERFGQNVADLVLSVTEQNKALPWEERKKEALEHIKTFSHDALLVKSADTISNVSEILDDYERDGEKTLTRFNAPEKMIKNYLEVVGAILKYWPENPLTNELEGIMAGLTQIEALGSESLTSSEKTTDLYLDEEQQKTRRIVFAQCEDEGGCGFFVEFKYSNCTFFFCKEHKMGFNLDLATIPKAGVECKQHGKMERYNILSEDNVCPSCERNTLAILSTTKKDSETKS